MNKITYADIFNIAIIGIIGGIIIPLCIFWGIDRAVSQRDYDNGYPLQNCIFSYNCNPDNFE